MTALLIRFIAMVLSLVVMVVPAQAIRETDSYDGNIFALYAGNGSLVPPAVTLADSQQAGRTSVIVYYLDDSRTSKAFSPSVSELQRLWGNNVDLLPLTTDALQGRTNSDRTDPAHYWHGIVPQVVVIDGNGQVLLDENGQVPLEQINGAISQATGIPAPQGQSMSLSFNELNTEVISR
tara:strand:- start:636 stop:1172 length:537 start_codon:yes stop_codon:yes gene_type:complete